MSEQKDIYDFLESYCELVENNIKERWNKLPIEIYNHEIFEVIGGLMARQGTLAIEFAKNPSIWNIHIAPIILRSMTDALITISWMMINNFEEKAQTYIKYGLGREKLLIEHYKDIMSKELDEELKEQYEDIVEFRKAWLEAQRYDFLTDVDISSSWSGVGTRTMAQESDCENLYKFAYEPYSSTAHNTWQHINMYNLKTCKNPLHKHHKIPSIPELTTDINFLINASKYLTRSFEAIDNCFTLEIDSKCPYDFIMDYLEDTHKEEE